MKKRRKLGNRGEKRSRAALKFWQETSNEGFPQQKSIQSDNNQGNYPAHQGYQPRIGEAAHDFAIRSKKYQRYYGEAQLQRQDHLAEYKQLGGAALAIQVGDDQCGDNGDAARK